MLMPWRGGDFRETINYVIVRLSLENKQFSAVSFLLGCFKLLLFCLAVLQDDELSFCRTEEFPFVLAQLRAINSQLDDIFGFLES